MIKIIKNLPLPELIDGWEISRQRTIHHTVGRAHDDKVVIRYKTHAGLQKLTGALEKAGFYVEEEPEYVARRGRKAHKISFGGFAPAITIRKGEAGNKKIGLLEAVRIARALKKLTNKKLPSA